MNTESDIKQDVREFYDQVGWQQVSEGVYQNARYEDLRPVSREYIHQTMPPNPFSCFRESLN